jgi:hypothetical protein
MASRKVDKHIIGAGEAIEVDITSTTQSTSGLTLYAYARNEAGTDVVIGSAAGAVAGTDITITTDWGLVSASSWYSLIVIADPAGTPVKVLPNKSTADEILVHVVPIPTSTS